MNRRHFLASLMAGAVAPKLIPAVSADSDIIRKIIECGQVLDRQNVPTQERWMIIQPWMAKELRLI